MSNSRGGRSSPRALARSSCVSRRQARKLATSLAATRTRPSVTFIDPHVPKVSNLTAVTPSRRNLTTERACVTAPAQLTRGPRVLGVPLSLR